jgi:dihydroorotate dehydrogenase (fumarate)
MTKIDTQLLGFTLRSPLVAASGPMSCDFAAIERLAMAGIGAIVTKTILLSPSVNPRPCLYRGKGYFLNTERCSTLPLQRWLDNELPRLKQLNIPIIASIGMTPAEVERLAGPVVEAGADMLELSIFTPYDDPTPMEEAIRRVKAVVDVPVSVKLSANVHDIVEFGRAVRDAGANAISAIDALKAGLHVDMETRRPVLLEQGFGRISGEAIKALALYHVAQLAHYVGLPLIGTGGVMSGADALAMIACGATAVGVCTALIVKGPEIITEVNEQMAQFMRQHKIESLTALQGDALSRIDFPASIEERREYEKQRVELPDRVALIDQSLCTRCQTCYRVCPHKAVERRGEAFFVHPSLCQGCGLCVSMCPVGAIRYAQESDKGR